MRIDKYLKVSRILKRRTVSKELADQDRVLINGKVAKPSSEVHTGDEVELFFGNRRLKVRVMTIEYSIRKADAVSMYEVIEESLIPHKPLT